MATIPLPALHTAPIEQPTSPLAMMGQMMGIKNAQQEQEQRAALAPLQQQQAQQAVQSGQLSLQEQQQAMKDQFAFRTAMQTPENQGKTIGDIADTLAHSGGISMKGWQDMNKADMEQRMQNATLTETQLKNNKATTDQLSSIYNNAMAMKPEDFASSWPTLVQQIVHIPGVQQMKLDPNQPMTQDQLSHVGPFLQMHNQYLDEELARRQKQTTLQKDQGEMDPSSPMYAPSPAAVAMGTAPGAAAIQKGEARQAGAKAGAEAAARQPYELALAAQRQALSQGDPNAAGQLLVNGDATLGELKARGATPDFIQKALTAAHRLSGGTYNAQQAEAQFDVAKSPTNVAFFGSARSLTDKGGTLDQLEAAGKTIPGGTFPAFNSIADWENAATGSGPIAKYASLALGVADDYSKVMGGGQGSDTSRLQALKLIAAAQSPEQRAASVEGIRGAVSSQMTSRIGKNPVLQRMYGSGAETPAQTAPSSGGAPRAGAQGIAVGSVITQGGHRYRVTAVDQSGMPTATEAAQ